MKTVLVCLALACLALTACNSAEPINAAVVTQPTFTPAPTSTSTPPPTSPPSIALLPTATATPTPTASPTPSPTATASPTVTPTPTPVIRQLTEGDCCTQPYWSADSTEVRFIDQDPQTGRTGLFGLDITRPESEPYFITDRLGFYSPDGRLLAYPDRATGLAVIEDLETGETWSLDLQESPPSFTPDGQKLFWVETNRDLPFEQRVSTLWLADLQGKDRRRLITLRRGYPLAWLDNNTLLISAAEETPAANSSFEKTILARLSLEDGSLTELFRVERPRGISLNRARTDLVYYSTLTENGEGNGVWRVDLTEEIPTPQRLPFLGSYHWQNNQTLIYIPFAHEAESHFFYSYNLLTGETRQLTSADQPLITVTNNDWAVSPDGTKIVLMASKNKKLAGLWLVELKES